MSASERLVHEHPALVAGDGALVERVDDRVCEQDVVGELGLESVDQEVLREPLHRRGHIGTTANLRADNDVQIAGYIHAGQSVDLHAGMDGTGQVRFDLPNLDLWGSSIALRSAASWAVRTPDAS